MRRHPQLWQSDNLPADYQGSSREWPQTLGGEWGELEREWWCKPVVVEVPSLAVISLSLLSTGKRLFARRKQRSSHRIRQQASRLSVVGSRCARGYPLRSTQEGYITQSISLGLYLVRYRSLSRPIHSFARAWIHSFFSQRISLLLFHSIVIGYSFYFRDFTTLK